MLMYPVQIITSEDEYGLEGSLFPSHIHEGQLSLASENNGHLILSSKLDGNPSGHSVPYGASAFQDVHNSQHEFSTAVSERRAPTSGVLLVLASRNP